MIDKFLPFKFLSKVKFGRSIVKTITYRLVILTLDFIVIFLFTGKKEIALGFMVLSNIYTSLIYFFHERLWTKIKWGQSNSGEQKSNKNNLKNE